MTNQHIHIREMAETKSTSSTSIVKATSVADEVVEAAKQLDKEFGEKGSTKCLDLVRRWYAKPTDREIGIKTMDGVITTTMCDYLSESAVLVEWLQKLDRKEEGKWTPYDEKEEGFDKKVQKLSTPTFFIDCGKNDLMRWLYAVKKIPFVSNAGNTSLCFVTEMNRRMRLNEWKSGAAKTLSEMVGIKLSSLLCRHLASNPGSVKPISGFCKPNLREWTTPLSSLSASSASVMSPKYLRALLGELTSWTKWTDSNCLSEESQDSKRPSFLPKVLMENIPSELRPLARDPVSHEFAPFAFDEISFRYSQSEDSVIFTFHLPTK